MALGSGIQKVLDDDFLLRRVRYPHPSYIREDYTVTSFAFKLRKNIGETGLSVDIARLTTYQKSIIDVSQFRLFKLSCNSIRQLGLDCIHKPEEDNYSHAEITGEITNGISSKLAKEAFYVPFP